jgi:hypothetical protein
MYIFVIKQILAIHCVRLYHYTKAGGQICATKKLKKTKRDETKTERTKVNDPSLNAQSGSTNKNRLPLSV